MERLQRGNLRGEQADCCGESTALVMNVGAKAADVRPHKTKIDGAVFLEFVGEGRGEHRLKVTADFVGGSESVAGGGQCSVHPEGDGRVGDEQNVGSVFLGGDGEELVEIGWCGGGLVVGTGSPGSRAVQLSDQAGEFAVVGGHGYSIAEMRAAIKRQRSREKFHPWREEPA